MSKRRAEDMPEERRKASRQGVVDYEGHQARYQAKIDKQLANVQDLTDHKVALATALFEPLPSPPTLDLLLERLDQVAEKQGTGKFASFSNRDLAEQVARLVPLPRAMNYGLPDESLDYISKLLTDFWTVGPLHPALVDSEAEEDKNKFKLYIRMRKTTVGALHQIIAKLKRTRPVNSPSLIAMEASLSGLAQDAVIYEKYIGETVQSASERHESDVLHSASASGKGGSKKSKWLHRLSLLETTDEPFKVYHVKLNASVPSKPKGWTDAQAKMGIPQWGLLEHIAILACSGKSWNSAPGGLCLMWKLPPTLILDATPLNPTPLQSSAPTSESPPLEKWMLQHFKRFRGRISEKALLQAAEAASPQSSTLRLAKDITIYDARGLGGWWDETAGASPKLLRLLLEIVRGNVSCCRFSFGSTEFENPPPIMDYWGVTTVHRQMDLADAFVAIVLEKRKPRLIITASEKVHNMLVGGQFCLECAQSETERLLVDDDVDDVDVVKYARAMRKARTRARKANEAETGKGKSSDKDQDEDDNDGVKPSDDDEEVKPSDDEDSDPESDEWQDFQRGGFVNLAGSIHAVPFGHSRWGVSIVTIDTGFYKYMPVLQPSLLPLFILVEKLCQIAEESCQTENIDTEEQALALKARIEVKGGYIIKQIETYKATALRHINAINSLANLHYMDEDPLAALARFDRYSAHFQKARQNYLASLTVAIGKPRSLERRQQLDNLIKDPSFVHTNPDCTKGSNVWKEMLLNVEEGKALMQTWHRARPSSEKVNLHLEKARKEAAKSSSSKAATKGPFKGWNSRKSLEEVIGIITDVEQASEDRTKITKAQMRILHCTLEECKFPFGIETEDLKPIASNHWCNPDEKASQYRTQVGSSIKETPLLFPVDLFEHPAFREDVERILSSSSSSSSAIGRVELVADDGKKIPAWVKTNTGTEAQRQAFVDAQYTYVTLLADCQPDDELEFDKEDIADSVWEVLCKELKKLRGA